MGINEEDFERIFLDFNRLDQHRQEAQGVGLGLSVVSRISQHLNHPIQVASRPGSGSCFSVSVPLSAEQKELGAATRAPTTQNKRALTMRVLVVDNDSQNTDALETVLDGWGCEVTTASTEAEALTASQPDLLIVDYHLGESLTGFALYKKLKIAWQHDVPAILVTAHGEANIKRQAANQNMGYLAKPVKPIALRALIKAVID
jgi:CheY-like chemotaxis protein